MNDTRIHLASPRRWVVGLVVCAALLFACPDVACAAGDATSSSVLPLFGGVGTYVSGFANRARVVQLCVVCMCAALLIIMKKFADVPSRPPLS